MRKAVSLWFTGAILCCPLLLWAAPPDLIGNWSSRKVWRQSGIAGLISGGVAGNSVTVAVGEKGSVMTSEFRNPIGPFRWIDRISGVSANFNSIAFGAGLFVAVGDQGTIVTSLDGTDWVSRDSGTTRDLRDITYAQGRFYVVGTAGTVLSSADGAAWNRTDSGTEADLSSVAAGGKWLIAVGASGTVTRSQDGLKWTAVSAGTRSFRAITFGKERFLAVSDASPDILGSVEGEAWTIQHTSAKPGFNDVAYVRNAFFTVGGFAAGTGYLLASADGTNWIEQTADAPHALVTIASGRELANTPEGYREIVMAAGVAGLMLVSRESGQWFRVNRIDTLSLADFAAGNGASVVAGGIGHLIQGALAASRDGTNWMMLRVDSSTLADVTFANGLFVAVGGLYSAAAGILVRRNWIFTSTEGLRWTRRPVAETIPLYAVAYGNGIYVAMGTEPEGAASSATTYATAISRDGLEWTVSERKTISSSWPFSLRLTFGKGVFVAAGPALFTSSDGVTWTVRRQGTHGAVQFGNGKFVALDERGDVVLSDDGTNWTNRPALASSPLGAGAVFPPNLVSVSLSFVGGMFVMVRSKQIYLSCDGQEWTEQTARYPEIGGPIGEVNGRFSVLSFDANAPSESVLFESDAIRGLTAPYLLPDSARPDGQGNVRLLLRSRPGEPVSVDLSNALANWQALRTLTPDCFETELPDQSADGDRQRFYRVRRAVP